MKTAKISARIPSKDLSTEFDMELPETLAEATAVYGEESVFELFEDQLIVRIQSIARTRLEAGMNGGQIADLLKDWKPGTRLASAPRDTVEDFAKKFATATPEEQATMLARLREIQAKAKAAS